MTKLSNDNEKGLEDSKDPQKPKVGFYDVTGCQGCVLSVIFNEDEILDIIGAVDIK
jgi:coenzyme F420-reducing hydrogenase gamma subunit